MTAKHMTPSIKLFPHQSMEPEILHAYIDVFRTFIYQGNVLPGGNKYIQEFEQKLERFTGADFAVGTGSGTTALVTALRSLDLPAGSEVITTPYTYQATASAIIQAGLKPIFADIDISTMQLADSAAIKCISENTSAIVPVHLNGSVCALPLTKQEAKHRSIRVVDDSAQRLTSTSFIEDAVDVVCFSLGPTKNIVGYMEAGAILTSDKKIMEKARILLKNGSVGNFSHVDIGYNGVMDGLAAALLTVNLTYLEVWNARRAAIAKSYDEQLGQCQQIQLVTRSRDSSVSKYSFYAFEGRDNLYSYLQNECGIEVDIYYPTPLHLQPCFLQLGYAHGDFPQAERAASHVISLPIHHALKDADVDYICQKIRSFYA